MRSLSVGGRDSLTEARITTRRFLEGDGQGKSSPVFNIGGDYRSAGSQSTALKEHCKWKKRRTNQMDI